MNHETTLPKELKKGNNCWLYQDYTISYSNFFGYEFSHKDYDGPEDSRCGHEKTLEEALDIIDEQIIDSEQRDKAIDKLVKHDQEIELYDAPLCQSPCPKFHRARVTSGSPKCSGVQDCLMPKKEN